MELVEAGESIEIIDIDATAYMLFSGLRTDVPRELLFYDSFHVDYVTAFDDCLLIGVRKGRDT